MQRIALILSVLCGPVIAGPLPDPVTDGLTGPELHIWA